MKKPPQKPEANVLTGKYFHSLKEGHIHWQGFVAGQAEPGLYLVQLFEWLSGGPSNMTLVTIEQMKDWLFYENLEQLTFSYEYGVAKKLKYEPKSSH